MSNIGDNFATLGDWEALKGSSILITGGTGSFGKCFIEMLLKHCDLRRLVIFSRDELKQYDVAMALEPLDHNNILRFFIGDVRDRDRLELAFSDIDIVVHAAAMKQVTTAEYNPYECIHTNVMGAENITRAALAAGVQRVLALSTDKAVNPINLYGASKLASDKIFVAANNVATKKGTKFSAVRYGNVIGSRGSVIPLFRKLIETKEEALPITDEQMTRFWITVQQGSSFVVSCINAMKGGEIFVPKIPSMRVVDVANAMAPDMPQKIVGIRTGEKLHEIMVTPDDARNVVETDDRYIILPEFPYQTAPWDPAAFGGKWVEPNFSYSSDTNTQWLTGEELLNLISSTNG